MLAPCCHYVMAFQWKSGTVLLCGASGTGLFDDYAGTSVTSDWRKVKCASRDANDEMTKHQHESKHGERW